jgi:hypothetical protein
VVAALTRSRIALRLLPARALALGTDLADLVELGVGIIRSIVVAERVATMNDRTNTRMPDAAYRGGAAAVAQRPDPWTAFFNEIDVRLTGETRQQYWAAVTALGIVWNVRHGRVPQSDGLLQIKALSDRLPTSKQDALRRLEDALNNQPQ